MRSAPAPGRNAPRRVAELLIFDPTLPRSLRFCFDEIDRVLQLLPQAPGRGPRRAAAEIHARLKHDSLEDIRDDGLHAYLERFVADNVRLGDAVQAARLQPDSARSSRSGIRPSTATSATSPAAPNTSGGRRTRRRDSA